MLHSRPYLTLCHELLVKGYKFPLYPGLRIGRGFADIGYEEYSVLTGFNVVSLHTGKAIAIEADFDRYYFPIYSVDEIAKELYERHCDVQEIRYMDQRTWMIFLTVETEAVHRFEGTLLEEAFLRALLWRLER